MKATIDLDLAPALDPLRQQIADQSALIDHLGNAVNETAAETDELRARLTALEAVHVPAPIPEVPEEPEPPQEEPEKPIEVVALSVSAPGRFAWGFAKGRMFPGVTGAQVTPKVLYDDGSIRHALITAETTSVVLAPGTPSGEAVDVAAAARAVNDIISLTYNGETQEIPVAGEVAAEVAKESPDYWDRGPLVTEVRVSVPSIVPGCHWFIDVRAHADGRVDLDPVHCSGDLKTHKMAPDVYDLRITRGGEVVHDLKGFVQHHHTRPSFWVGREDVRPIGDWTKLADAGLLPQYRRDLDIDPAIIDETHRHLTQLGLGNIYDSLIGDGGNEGFMAAQGQPIAGIMGPLLNKFQVWAFTAPGEKTWAMMLGHADCGATIPWHVRDGEHLVSIEDWPGLTMHGNTRIGADNPWPERWSTAGNEWSIDRAHQPNLAEIAYLLTGRRRYLDQMLAESVGSLLQQPASGGYRQGAKGIVVRSQVRGQAACLRNLFNAATLTPDDHPQKAYYGRLLGNNLDDLANDAPADKSAWNEVEGWRRVGAHDSPWMHDYLILVLGRIYDATQDPRAFARLDYYRNFMAGRFTLDASGTYGPGFAASYKFYWRFNDAWVTCWKDLAIASKFTGRDPMPGDTGGGFNEGGQGDCALAGIRETRRLFPDDPKIIAGCAYAEAHYEAVGGARKHNGGHPAMALGG